MGQVTGAGDTSGPPGPLPNHSPSSASWGAGGMLGSKVERRWGTPKQETRSGFFQRISTEWEERLVSLSGGERERRVRSSQKAVFDPKERSSRNSREGVCRTPTKALFPREAQTRVGVLEEAFFSRCLVSVLS